MPRRKKTAADISDLIKDVAASEPAASPDAQAEGESKLFGTAERQDRYQASVHWVVVSAVWMVGLTVVVTLVLRLVILVLPTPYRWLTDEQLHAYDQVVLSGTLGGILTHGAGRLTKGNKRR